MAISQSFRPIRTLAHRKDRCMRPTISIFVLALCFVTIAVAADLNIKTEMKTAVDPATTIIFALAGEVDPANGPDAAKVATSRWDEALSASQTLKTAATRLNRRGEQKERRRLDCGGRRFCSARRGRRNGSSGERWRSILQGGQ